MAKRILIIEVNWIGDILFSTPFIRAVRQAHPDAYIACLLHPRCKEMLESNERLDEIIIYDEEGEHRSIFGKLKLIRILRKKRFDTAFILHRSFTKALIATLAGIKNRIGYPTKHRSVLLTRVVEDPDDEAHKVEYFLNIARSSGIKVTDSSYEFFIQDSDRTFIKDLLKADGVSDADLLIAICPGGNWDPKRWPKENFAKLADMLFQNYGARIVIAGAKKDIRLAEDIEKLMKTKPVITCGRTTLKQLGALLERSNLVIANDTGPMHIAVSMKAKTIALFGPTSPDLTGPYGSGNYRVVNKQKECASPCYDFSCAENRCMLAIKVEDVFKEAAEMIKR